MTNPSSSRFLQLLEERRKAATAAEGPVEKTEEHAEDLIPSVDSGYIESQADIDIANLLDSIYILDAYVRWCGKSTPIAGGRTEGIKVSCPNPAHPDKNPSAWLNTEKNTFYCGACDLGGDKYDIAAYHFGYPVPGYKEGSQFRDLRVSMASSLGYHVESAPGISFLVREEEAEETPPDNVESEEAVHSGAEKGKESSGTESGDARVDTEERGDGTEERAALVVPLFTTDDDDRIDLPTLEWQPLVESGTFLDTWMQATKIDDIPDEYYFWNGMLAVGMAIGRDTNLYDRKPVFGNLFLCVVGETGSGKSQSLDQLENLLRKGLPYDHADPLCIGTKFVKSPASGEAAISAYHKEIVDPSSGKSIGLMPVRGIIDFNELSGLTARAGRLGNTLKSTLMDMYDAKEIVSTESRTHGVTQARLPFASLITTTQPKSMGSLLMSGDVSSGFLNRFLFISGAEKTRIPVGGVQISVDESVIPIQKIRAWGTSHKQVTWSSKAEALYTEWYHDFLAPAKRKSDTLSRLDLLTKKLILLFTANEMSPEVEVSSIMRVQHMIDYICRCYGVTGDMVGNDLAWEIREAIMRHVANHSEKGGITLYALNDRFKRKKYPTSLVRRTLDDLVHLGIISAQASKSGRGRPTVRYAAVEG